MLCAKNVYKQTGLNGGYYSAGGLQQAHSTTHDVPHSAAGSSLVAPPPPSVVNPSPVPTVPPVHIPPQVGLPHGLPLNAPDPNNHLSSASNKPEPSEVQ
ncbi:PREDICTED: C-terminal-binding protein-like isoform X2 [Rhagoletis zephyria]|uniref:C-terminal-binding protein-like isoform X2 n=1 Tax=Rhagoletis zephyria TaxID=28612 RepID=UPI0008117D37|nr:PREDICTED: C-terminal-binding protein-like isoform X2 [Rhagoletis zephyria]